VNGYPGFGATTAPKITFDFGPAWTQCMREEIAKGKAHPGTANTARCTSLMKGATSGGGIPLTYYLIGAAALVGGSAWYFFFRKPKAT